MLLLSTLVILATAGLSLLWQLARVYRIARLTPSTAGPYNLIAVLGLCLRDDQVSRGFAKRLYKAQQLYKQGYGKQVLILGGKTGNSSKSEAELGRHFLVLNGVPEDIIVVEDTSLHTLDNLRHARIKLGKRHELPFVMITDRYHLARSQALAIGLNLQPVLCATEEKLDLNAATVLRLIREAYYLHWYVVGKTWSQWTDNKQSLAKII